MTHDVRPPLGASVDGPPVRLADGPGPGGRRARRRRQIATLVGAGLATVLIAAATPLMLASRGPDAPAGDGDAVPGDLGLPWMWQATVQQDPPGQASVLFGGDSIGLRGIDLFDSEGKLAVVGRAGATRILRYGGKQSITAGEEVLLSPDGRRVAQPFLEDMSGVDGLIVTDLDTGASTAFPGTTGSGCCTPVAWAPDGSALLATQQTEDFVQQRFVILELATGTTVPLGGYLPSLAVRTASRGAFAPDGQRMVLTEGTTLRLVDRAGGEAWRRDLGDRTYLAGVGAFTPDGARIVTVTLDGCLDSCDEAALARRRWTFGYLDARTGADVDGPALAPVTGSAVRALGWTAGSDLVALRYEPETGAHKSAPSPSGWNDTGWYETGHVTLIGLRPDRSTVTLLDPPAEVLTMDVAADLLAAGRFRGPASTASMFPARGEVLALVLVPLGCLLVTLTVVVLVVVTRLRQRRRPDRWRS